MASIAKNSASIGSAGIDQLTQSINTLEQKIMAEVLGLQVKITDILLLIFAYFTYYGGIAGILFLSYLTILLVNTSLAGSALALVIQPWVGLGLSGVALLAVLLYMYFIPRPADVVGVDIKKYIPEKPTAPSAPSSKGWFSWLKL